MSHRVFSITLLLLFTSLAGCIGGSPSGHVHGEEYNGKPLSSGSAGDFTLTDENGSEFKLSSLKGEITVVSFIFTRCAEVCPMDTQKLRTAAEEIGDDASFVTVSIDPEYDTPERLKAYTEMHNVDWPHTTGDRASLETVWSNFGILVDKVWIDMHHAKNSIQVIHPDNTTEKMLIVEHDSLPENATGWNLTTSAFLGNNISYNWSHHEQFGHSLSMINESEEPSDWSWWWKLYAWNSSNSTWEESPVGIDSVEVGEDTHLAWVANWSDVSQLADPSMDHHHDGEDMDHGDNESSDEEEASGHSHSDDEHGHHDEEVVLENYTVGHNSIIFILDEEHDKRLALTDDDWKPEHLVSDVETLLSETEHEHSTPAAGAGLTLVAGLLAAGIIGTRLNRRSE